MTYSELLQEWRSGFVPVRHLNGNRTGTLKPAPLLVVPAVPVVPGEKIVDCKIPPFEPNSIESAWEEIESLPLLAEDRAFIRERIRWRPDGAALLARYVIFWRAAADGEPVDFRKANRGRFAANAWLRSATERPAKNQNSNLHREQREQREQREKPCSNAASGVPVAFPFKNRPGTEPTNKQAPRVLNAKETGRNVPGAVYCGRPGPWGNPFHIGRDGDRAEVVQKYRAWLMAQPERVAKARAELRGKSLVCWCAPLECHCDVLLEIANGEGDAQ